MLAVTLHFELIDSREKQSIYKHLIRMGIQTMYELKRVTSGKQHCLICPGIIQAVGYGFWHDNSPPTVQNMMNDVLKRWSLIKNSKVFIAIYLYLWR